MNPMQCLLQRASSVICPTILPFFTGNAKKHRMQYRLPCLEMRNALSKMPRSILVLMAWFSAQSVTIAQQSACFTIQENPFSDEAAFSGFSNYVHVLGVFMWWQKRGFQMRSCFMLQRSLRSCSTRMKMDGWMIRGCSKRWKKGRR